MLNRPDCEQDGAIFETPTVVSSKQDNSESCLHHFQSLLTFLMGGERLDVELI